MNVNHLVLLASLFAIGCGKSEEDRLDHLEAACDQYLKSYYLLQEECGIPDPGFDCAEQRARVEETGCIDEAEAALECGQNSDLDSLTCEDDFEAELNKCAEPAAALNDCVGGF